MIKTNHLGAGTLTLGAGALAVQGQITNCRVQAAEQVTTGTRTPVLSGEELEASERVNYNWTIAGNLFQDWDAAGVVDWSWTNKGTPQPFTFVPDTDAARQVTGICIPVPITIGGPVTGTPDNPGDPASSDFSWRCKGGDDEPVFAAVPAP
jgi:hypothetical protein